MTVELLTSLEVFDELHLLADGHKASVKVDRQALQNLLIDHSCLINAAGSKVKCPPPKRRRETILET